MRKLDYVKPSARGRRSVWLYVLLVVWALMFGYLLVCAFLWERASSLMD